MEWVAARREPRFDDISKSMLGFVILIGTVVNNAILIVHQSLVLMREEHADSKSAVLESVRTRIRHIFMTTGTTVLGLLPLVLFPGAGSELYRGLGSVVLGGLFVSTLFTLIFVPALFTLAMRLVGQNFIQRDDRWDTTEEVAGTEFSKDELVLT